MNTMTYRGHTARLEYEPADRVFVGRILGINDIVGFHAANVDDLETAFREAVDDYIEACSKAGKDAERAFSGRVMFRVDPGTHARAALAAQLRGVSLNQWAEEALLRQADMDLAGSRGLHLLEGH